MGDRSSTGKEVNTAQNNKYKEVTPDTPKSLKDTAIEMEVPSDNMTKVSSQSETAVVAGTPPPKMGDPETPMITEKVTRDIEVEDEEELIDEELVGDDLYIVVFEEKPFGVTFGKNDYDKRNLFVTGNDETAAGYQESVINGSYIAKLETEVVEGLGAKKIFKIFKNKYADKCPLKITFRKPENVTTTGGNEEDEGFCPHNPGGTNGIILSNLPIRHSGL